MDQTSPLRQLKRADGPVGIKQLLSAEPRGRDGG